MKILTICFGILLTLLGIGSYVASGMDSLWALMPALFGVLATFFGFLQGKWEHQHPLYGAILMALLSFIGSIRGLWNLFILLTGGEPVLSSQLIAARSMRGVLSLVFIILAAILIEDFWRHWKAFGQFLGDWLARIVLTIFYFTVFVPFGLGASLFSDQLRVKAMPDKLWRPRETAGDSLEAARRQAEGG